MLQTLDSRLVQLAWHATARFIAVANQTLLAPAPPGLTHGADVRAIHLAQQLPKPRKGKAVHAQAVGWPCRASGSDAPPAACHRLSTKAAVHPYGAKWIARADV